MSPPRVDFDLYRMISDTQVFAKTPKHVLLPKALHALACFLPPTSKKHLYTLSNHSACKVVAKLRFSRFARIAARTNAPFICRRQRSLLFPLRLQPAFGNRLAVLGDWFNSIMQIKSLARFSYFLPTAFKKHLYLLSNHSACKAVVKLRFPRFARIAARTNAPFICRRQRSLLFPLRLQPAFGNRLTVLGCWFSSIM